MAFWGLKLKPKKPVFVTEEDLEGRRLHITKATLGNYPAIDDGPRTIIKCRCGDGPVIYIGSLMPGSEDSCPLDLCFEETVAFTITGSTAVHLSGYTMIDDDEDFNDMGESDDEEFMNEDGFIVDDDEEEMEDDEDDEEELLGHPRSSVKIEEIPPSDVKASVETPKELGSEDEDGLPVKRKAADDEASNKKAKTSDTPAEAASPGETLSSKKKKKKAKKNAAKADGEEQPEGNGTESEKSPAKGKGKGKKKFANGLEIENVAMGKPDGKQAKAGKKGLTK